MMVPPSQVVPGVVCALASLPVDDSVEEAGTEQPPAKRSWVSRHKAITAAAAVLVVVGSAGGAVAAASSHGDEAACQKAVTELMDRARTGSEVSASGKPAACDGLDEATLNRIATSVAGKAFDDALSELSNSLSPAAPTESEISDAPAYIATTSDFKIALKIKSKACFGDAGCNVTYEPELTIVGAQVDQDGCSYEITYEVRGGEDGPAIDTIELDSGQYQQTEGIAQTARQSSKLTAVITDVETR